MPAIEACGLSRTYRSVEKSPGISAALRSLFKPRVRLIPAVADVSFAIEEGEMVAFLGPNGAGKTTTLKMLAGLLRPSGGSIRVLGFTPADRALAFRRQIAFVMGQRSQLAWDLPARESFRLQAAIYSIPRAEFPGRLQELAAIFRAGDILARPVRELSLGERMKLELMAAFLPQPRLLLLDEPTIGLDVVSQVAIRECLRTYSRARRVTTILTSHTMQDIESLCTRAIIINGGRILHDGSIARLREIYGRSALVTMAFTGAVPETVENWGEVVSREPSRIVLRVERQHLAGHLAGAWNRLALAELSVQESSLDEVMIRAFLQGNLRP